MSDPNESLSGSDKNVKRNLSSWMSSIANESKSEKKPTAGGDVKSNPHKTPKQSQGSNHQQDETTRKSLPTSSGASKSSKLLEGVDGTLAKKLWLGGRTLAWGVVAPRSRCGGDGDGDGGLRADQLDEGVAGANHVGSNDTTRLVTDLQGVLHTMVQNLVDGRASGSRLVEFMKLRSPTYDGLGQPKAAETWFDEIEKFFRAAGVVDPVQKVNLATLQLKDDAAMWWRGVRKTCSIGDMEWSEFKEQFFLQFFPDTARDELRNRFERLYQGGMTVHEYFLKFTSLARYAPELVANEDEKQRRFRRGLNPVIALHVAAPVFENFAALVKGAQQVEATMIQNRRIGERLGRSTNGSSGRRDDRKRTWEVANNRGSMNAVLTPRHRDQ